MKKKKKKNDCNAFPTGAKIHFREKKYLGVRGTLSFRVGHCHGQLISIKQTTLRRQIECLEDKVCIVYKNGYKITFSVLR